MLAHVPSPAFANLGSAEAWDAALADVPPGALERILRLAARTFEVPLCLVVLTDAARSELLGCHGWDVRTGEERPWEVGRTRALALDAALGGRGLRVLHDTATGADPAFAPGGALHGVHAYAAVALHAPGEAGRRLGSFLVLDTAAARSQPLRAGELQSLTELAALAAETLGLHLAGAARNPTGAALPDAEAGFLRAVLDVTDAPLVATDATGARTICSAGARALFTAAGLGSRREEWFDPTLGRALLPGNDAVGEAEDEVALGARAVLARARPLPGGAGGAVVSLEDVTARRQADGAARARATELERQLAARTAELARTEESLFAERVAREADRRAAAERVRVVEASGAARAVELQRRDEVLARMRVELDEISRESRRLAAAVESAQTGILISDPTLPDAPVIFCNTGFTRVTGYGHAEIVGQNCRFLQGPDTNPQTVRTIREAVAAGKPYHGLVRNYKKDGTPFWNELIVNPVHDEEGRLTNFVGLQSDVTVRVEALEALRQSQLRFARMAANVPGMVFQLVRDAVTGVESFAYASDGCRELFGVEAAAVCADAGTLWATIHPEEAADFRRAVVESAQMLTPLAWEGSIRQADGTVRGVQVIARPERQADGGTLWDGLFLDVTARRAAEEVLRERGRQAAAVAALGLRALEGTETETLLREASHIVSRHLRAEQCTIAETLPDGGGSLTVRAAAGWREGVVGQVFGAGTGSQAGFALLQRRPLLVEDYANERRFPAPSPIAKQSAVSGLSVVLHGRGRAWGALCVQTTARRRFAAEDVAFVQAVANVLASALDRADDENALRQSEQRHAAILETVPDGMLTIDHEGTILDVNRAAESTFGHERGALLGRRVHEAILPQSLDPFGHEGAAPVAGTLPAYLTAGENGALDRRVEIPGRHADGHLVLCELSVTRIPVEGMPQFTVSLRDISARRAADDRMRMLESSVDHANDAILITEAEPFNEPGPRIIYANQSFLRSTGYTLEEIIGKTPRILQGPGTLDSSKAKIRRALERWRPVRVEVLNYRKDGTEFWVELNIVPVANERGWFTHWVSVQRDVTERKRTEEILNRAKEAAESADRAKSDFLSRMSHELRTPLNAILGFGQLMEMQSVPGVGRDRAGHVVKAGRHLLDLINEVLDISRIESGHLLLSPESVGLAEVLGEALDLMRPLAAQHGVEVAFEPGGVNGQRVVADRQRLKQVILNLLSNAVKYNRPGGGVRIACSPGEAGAEPPSSLATTPPWRVTVSDDGPGIPEDKRARLFLPFERLGAEHSSVAGSGLGLALSKRLMEAMDGDIGLDGVSAGGSTFWLQLPAAAGEADLPPVGAPRLVEPTEQTGTPLLPTRHTPAGSRSAPRTVLMIEDNLSNLTLVEHLLTDQPDVRLLSAMQGQLGLDLARRHRPDLILLDVHLPDLPGHKVLAQLRADAATAHIPVVVVSADATRLQIDRLMAAGARAYLTKPLEVNGFMQTLRDLLGIELLPVGL